MPENRYRRTSFVTSAHEASQLPPDTGREVAFAGRSNSGKSSVLNAVADNRRLARTAKLPGRTRLINVFAVEPAARLVDLPGYGYARVDAALKRHWADALTAYFTGRGSLVGVVLVMDVRHPLTGPDRNMLQLAASANCPVHVVLNKADKVPRAVAHTTGRQLQHETAGGAVTVQALSARSGEGVEELRRRLDGWLFP